MNIKKIRESFGTNDISITLTYTDETIDNRAAKKNLMNFIRRIRFLRKKNGLSDLKYLAVTETEKPQHHIITHEISQDIISKLWPFGRNQVNKFLEIV